MNSLYKMNKLLSKQNYDILLKFYNSLKIILEPNLSEGKKNIMNHVIEIIISQLQIFIDLHSLKELNKKYELLNINNQNLSKKISNIFNFYENPSIILSPPFSDSSKQEESKKEVIIETIKENDDSMIKYNNITNIENKKTNYDKDEEEIYNNKNESEIVKKNKNIKINKKFQFQTKPLSISTSLNNKYNIINQPKLVNNIYQNKHNLQNNLMMNNINNIINISNRKSNLTEGSNIVNKKSFYTSNKKNRYKNIITKNEENTKRKVVKSLSKRFKRISPLSKSELRLHISRSGRFRKPILFDRTILKVCHNAINNYKELERRESDHHFPAKKQRSSNLLKSINYSRYNNNNKSRNKDSVTKDNALRNSCSILEKK